MREPLQLTDQALLEFHRVIQKDKPTLGYHIGQSITGALDRLVKPKRKRNEIEEMGKTLGSEMDLFEFETYVMTQGLGRRIRHLWLAGDLELVGDEAINDGSWQIAESERNSDHQKVLASLDNLGQKIAIKEPAVESPKWANWMRSAFGTGQMLGSVFYRPDFNINSARYSIEQGSKNIALARIDCEITQKNLNVSQILSIYQ